MTMLFKKIILVSFLFVGLSNIPLFAYADTATHGNETVYCHHCRFANPPNAKRCVSCKIRLFGNPCNQCNTMMRPGYRYCPHCNYDSKNEKKRRTVRVPCVKCKELYDPALKSCPHCSGLDHNKTKANNLYHDDETLYFVDSFTKSDSKRYTLRSPIDSFTKHQSFSKIVVECAADKHPVIVNSAKTYKNGKRIRTKVVGKRLKNGRNVIPLKIAKGTSELVLSFDHGRDCDVQVYLE
jgi:hypothetical protein